MRNRLLLAAVAAILAAVTVAAIAAPFPGRGARAQGIDVRSQTVENRFPDGVAFRLDVSAASPVAEVRLRYTIHTPEGSPAFGDPECSGGRTVQCTFELESKPTSFLVPKTDITYSWEVRDESGGVLETEPERITYEDDRFQWESQSEDNLTVWYYDAGEDDVREVLRVGRETLDDIGALLDTRIEFPVKVLFYASAGDMQRAIDPRRQGDGPVTLGEVVYSDTAMVSQDVVPLDIVRHELTHIVEREALKGPFGDAPSWLSEGLAIWAQSRLLSDEQAALERAIRDNRVFSLRSMTSSSLTQGGDVSLFYGQSYSIVAYLLDNHGEENLSRLFAAFRGGATTDQALLEVYGFDQEGLEDAWRDSVGLSPAARPTPSGESQPRPIPQLTPFGAGGEEPAAGPTEAPRDGGEPASPASGGDGDDGVPVVTLIVVLAVTVLVAGGIAAGGVLLLRRR